MSHAMLPQCFSIYVEKELVGKRLKSSKVRVSWQLAFEKEYIVHHVELRHSIVSGKREILIDGQMVFSNKSMFSGTFEHHTRIAGGHELRISVTDTFEGYIYDLVCDNVQFHKMPRKSVKELESLRAGEANANAAPVVSTDFASFTGKSSALLDGERAFKSAVPLPPIKQDASLLDWDVIQPQPVPQQQQQQQYAQFNPFESSQPPSQYQPQYQTAPSQPQYQAAPSQPQYNVFGGGGSSSYDPFSSLPPAVAYQPQSAYQPPPTYQQQQQYQPPAQQQQYQQYSQQYQQAPIQQQQQQPSQYQQAPPQQYQANPFSSAPAQQQYKQAPYDPFS
ncbi:hypothetical protein BASA81_014016 [Batrachochytrium salamandrivorans]|nr:hypothetical protein BASA81_014016 [Batrachochytrium salamandrivorans]